MQLRKRLEREFALRFDDLSSEMKICVEGIEQLELARGSQSGHSSVACNDGPSDLSTRLNSPTDAFPITIGLALSDRQRQSVFRLRHDSFVESGWIAPNASQTLCDAFDDLPTTILIEAVADGRTAATLRIAMSGPPSDAPSLPCEVEFPSEINALRARHGPRLAEFSRVAIDPDITNTSFKTTLYGGLVRTAFVIAWAADIDYAFAAVHERVSSFYRHMIGFERVARSSSFGIIAEPTELLGCAGTQLFRRAALRSRFFQVQPGEFDRAHMLLQAFFPALAIAGTTRHQRPRIQ